jgi:hypothetical protein
MPPSGPLDAGGLAAMIGATRGTHWPVDAREVSEVPSPSSRLQAPLKAADPFTGLRHKGEFVDPSFIGPMPPVQEWDLPIHMRKSILRGMVDPLSPVEADERRALMQRLLLQRLMDTGAKL